MNFNEKLIQLRKSKGLSQDELGNALGVSRQTISKWEFARSNKMCVILCSMQGIVAITTWAGWISLLPICANIASTIGGYTHNAQKIRIAGMFFNSPLWIIYDLIIGSWAGAIDELASIISAMISIRRYGWKNLNQIDD